MNRMAAHLHLTYIRLMAWIDARPHDQRGSTTVEQIAWTAFLVGLAVAAFVLVRNYTDGKLAILK